MSEEIEPLLKAAKETLLDQEAKKKYDKKLSEYLMLKPEFYIKLNKQQIVQKLVL